jgi:flagellar hook-basal body complex protein FliE
MIPGPIHSATSAAVRELPSLVDEPVRGAGFSEMVGGVLEQANTLQSDASEQARKLAAGEGDIVESLLAASRADLSLRFVVSMRNRALDAYNEIMRLQV